MKKGQLSFLSIAMLVFFLTIGFSYEAFACGSVEFNGQTISMSKCMQTSMANAEQTCRGIGQTFWNMGGGRWGCSSAPSKDAICKSLGTTKNAQGTGCNGTPEQRVEVLGQNDCKQNPNSDACLKCKSDDFCSEGETCIQNKCTKPKSSRADLRGTSGQECRVEGAQCNAGLEGKQIMGGGDVYCVCYPIEKKAVAGCNESTSHTPAGDATCGAGKKCVYTPGAENNAACMDVGSSDASVRPAVVSALKQADDQINQCKADAKEANESCDQESNAEFKKSKDEATSAFRNLSQAAQNAGASSMFIKTANFAAVVEVGMSSMRISCENKGTECTKSCTEAKNTVENILPQLITKAEKDEGQKTVKELETGYKDCLKYKGALAGLINDITKNAMSRMQALIAGGCTSNSMPADLQYCCKQPTPATCYNDPRISDPTQTAWVPPTTPNVTTNPNPACVDNPALCNVSSKPQDLRNTTGGGDFGRSGGSSNSGGRTGGMPNFDLGSDGTSVSQGGTQKPTDLSAPPPSGPGGGGIGGGGLSGGGSGGLSSGAGGGEHGSGGGDSLFDGMRGVGGSDPNKLSGFNGTAGGPNSLALGSAKLGGNGATAGIGKDGRPDFSKFALDPKSKLGIRGVAGATGPDGITGPDTNIWKKINSGYVNDIIYTPETSKKGK